MDIISLTSVASFLIYRDVTEMRIGPQRLKEVQINVG